MERIKIDATSAICGALLGCVAGAVVGYLYSGHRLRSSFETELEKAHDYYRTRMDKERDKIAELAVIKERREQASGISYAASLGYGNPASTSEDEPVGIDRAYDDAESRAIRLESEDDELGEEDDDESDFHDGVFEELTNELWPPDDRDISKPFRISAAEFHSELAHFSKLTITYYHGDNVLADEKERPIPNIENLVGKLQLEDFGGISEDPHIMLVRNYKQEADFEIILNRNTYAEVVLGMPSKAKGPGPGS